MENFDSGRRDSLIGAFDRLSKTGHTTRQMAQLRNIIGHMVLGTDEAHKRFSAHLQMLESILGEIFHAVVGYNFVE